MRQGKICLVAMTAIFPTALRLISKMLGDTFMKSILIDAGPIIALYRKNDLYHEKALAFIKSFKGRLITT